MRRFRSHMIVTRRVLLPLLFILISVNVVGAGSSAFPDASLLLQGDCPSFPATIPDGRVDLLQDALECAETTPGTQTINLATNGLYTVSTPYTTAANGDSTGVMVIFGGSAVIINGNGATITRDTTAETPEFRFFSVRATASLTLNDVTLSNGKMFSGGAIWVDQSGTLAVNRSRFIGNVADDHGGAIYSPRGTLTVSNSTFEGNEATALNGGAIANTDGRLTITGSTFTNNEAGNRGGGIAIVSSDAQPVVIANSTISGNRAVQGGGVFAFSTDVRFINTTITGNQASANNGAGIHSQSPGTVRVRNTIIANSVTGYDCVSASPLQAETTSLLADWSCPMSPDSNRLIGNPSLGPLADNGGPTQTHRLLPGSIAIDRGDNATCAASPISSLDQRGMPRILDGDGNGTATCDLGAYEVAPAPLVMIEQAENQNDPTSQTTVQFSVVFSQPVTDFDDASDIDLTDSTAGGTLAVAISDAAPLGDGMTYTVSVSGITGEGVVVASVVEDAAENADEIGNEASTSTDNSVRYETTTVTINKASGQSDPTSTSPIRFAVVFNTAVTGFTDEDVDLSASTTGGTLVAAVTDAPPLNDNRTYLVSVSGMGNVGDVIARIPADVVEGGNVASTTSDNSVTYTACPTFPAIVLDGRTDQLVKAIQCSYSTGTEETINLAANGLYVISTPFQSGIGLPGLSSEKLTINGNGATIMRDEAPGTPEFTLISASGTANLVLNDLTLSNGAGTNGGAIDFFGLLLTVTNSRFTGNHATNNGGAISVSASNGLTIQNSTFEDNRASARGGAIAVIGGSAKLIANSTFNGN